MPHFIIDCPPSIISQKPPEEIIAAVHNAADATGLFGKGDIKVRVRVFENYTVGGERKDFIHVFGYIMQGRTQEQKSDLSKQIVKILNGMFPIVPVISMNVSDFEKATYYNKTML